MSSTVIRAEGLGKQYHLGERERYLALRDVLVRAARSPLKFFQPTKSELIWALKDVSFQVQHGEVIGVVGRNGSGKTTLLKILSRITRPTTGIAEIYGSVRTLLEVGTGFHPELTGRENMYLSGAVLGMSRREIERKFDTIVSFSGVERFIDTQLKHYSTGMQMRLAFAVAAHLEPDILLVDEVLAVGDLEFQKKCLGKMEEVSGSGRTILFVSHQMNQIRRLCKRVLWLDSGEIYRSGPTAEVLGEYEAALTSGQRSRNQRPNGARTKASFSSWQIDGAKSGLSNFLTTMDAVTIRFQLQVYLPIRNGHHGITLYNGERQLIWGWAKDDVQLEAGAHEFCYTFPTLPLRPGPYSWMLSLWEDGKVVDLCDCAPDMIIDTEVHQHAQDQWSGVLNVPCRFEVLRAEDFSSDK